MALRRLIQTTRAAIESAFTSSSHGRPHYILFRDLPIAYGRIPKVANTSVKTALTRYVSNRREIRRRASYDAVWTNETNGETRMIRTRDAAELEGVFVFTFIRNPFDRVASFYNDKVAGQTRLPSAAGRDGVVKGMAFGPFLERLAEMDDRDMDDHLLPQAVILTHEGRVVPSFVGRHERMAADWDVLRGRLVEVGAPDPGDLPRKNRRAPGGHDLAAYYADPAYVKMVRERYGDDFELFYPDAEPLRIVR